MPVHQASVTETVFSGELKWHTTNEGQHAVLRFSERADGMSIDFLFVPSAARNQGIGGALVTRFLSFAALSEKDVRVDARPLGAGGAVKERLERLIRFYERLGFEPVQCGATQMRMIRKCRR